MSVFDNAKKRINDLKKAINPSIKEAFDRNEIVIKDFQVNKQMFDKGEDSKGKKISPMYTLRTKAIKRIKRQPINRVTLRDTGDFHRSIIVNAKPDEVEITTTIPYAKYLFQKYGDDILGIQEELLQEFAQKYILPTIKESFDDIIAES